jgi:hypothetical protein
MRRIAMTVAAALTCFAALTGCSDISAQLSGSQSSDPLEGDDTQPAPPLETVNWGTVDGLLSVVVSNPADRTLRYAIATIVALGADGQELGTFTDTALNAGCCTVADLPPGGAYGFYAEVGPDIAEVADVEMTYRDIAWGATQVPTNAALTVQPVGVNAGDLGAVVVADVSTPGPAVADAVVQAYLIGPDGEFLAVVSGRWGCFAAGETRRVWMQLFHPVPEGTQVHSMVAHPRLEAPKSSAPSCPA